jgi:lysophospholipase L1-like esterase
VSGHSRGRSFAFGLAGVLLTLSLCLVLVEGGLRLYSRVTPNVDVEFYRYASVMKGTAHDSGVVFRHTPDSRGRFFGVDVSINSQGFRDEEFGAPGVADDAIRVGLLGDSVTFGWGVAYGERFSELLERDWSARAGRRVDLLNTGHGNYNTVQEAATLVESLANVDLDALVQVWYINDAEPTPEHREAPWYARFHTAIFLWAKADLLQRRFGARENFEDYYRDLYRPDAAGFAAFRTALAQTGAWTRTHHVPWIFVVLPEFHGFDPAGPFADVYARVADEARVAGAQVVDATPFFAGMDPATVRVAVNDVHPNARGHAVIAEAIEAGVGSPPWLVGSDFAGEGKE